MENPISVEDENKLLVTYHDNDRDDDDNGYDDYNKPNTSRVDKRTFTRPTPMYKKLTSSL